MPCEKRSLFHRGEMLSLFHCGAFHCGKVPLGLVPQDESGVCYLENRESPKEDQMAQLKDFFATRWGIISVGGFIGIFAPLLQKLGNPGNMGICVACFERDIAGSIGIHRATVVQYMRPEIIGFRRFTRPARKTGRALHPDVRRVHESIDHGNHRLCRKSSG